MPDGPDVEVVDLDGLEVPPDGSEVLVAPLLRQLQQDGVVHRVRTAAGDLAWLVTGYEEVRRLLADERLGRSHPDPAKAARLGESVLFGGPMGSYDTEQADNARLRSLLQPHFSPRRMRAFRPRVEELTAGLFNDLAEHGPPADLHQALALPLPVQVICELLGVPYADREQFRAWSEALGDVRDRARSEHGLGELFGYGGSWWLASASSRVTTSSPGCTLTTSVVTRSRCCRWACCSPAMRRRWWRSAWAPCACWPIPASSRLLSRIGAGSPPQWRRYCALRAGGRRHPPLRPYRPADRGGHRARGRPSAAGQPRRQPRSHGLSQRGSLRHHPPWVGPSLVRAWRPLLPGRPARPHQTAGCSPSCLRAFPRCGSQPRSSNCGCDPGP